MTAATSVAKALSDRIAREGPLPLDIVMAAAGEAYYARDEVIGARGDFTTAPEISQTFGELIGLWCGVTWQQMGSPAPFRLVECGPGRGTLMADLLRAASRVKGFRAAARLHLVERSPALRARQAEALKDAAPTLAPMWHDDLADVPAGPTLLIANEFLDALPIKQFVHAGGAWAERHVDVDDDEFVFLDRATSPPAGAPETCDDGTVIEYAPAVDGFVQGLAARLKRDGGAALIIDYGYVGPATGNTLQAVKSHRYHGVLDDLGRADLTAHVDFGRVAGIARAGSLHAFGPQPQGSWLADLGLGLRVAQLTRGKTASEAAAIAAAAKRLSAPDGMGLLFKVMAIAHPSLARIEGFAQDAGP